MSTDMIWQIVSTSSEKTELLGVQLGSLLNTSAFIELVADVGGGKTTFVKGLARGLGCNENITSPTFTLSREYQCARDMFLHHYDLYRLGEAVILADELAESIRDNRVVTVIEWASTLKDILPVGRIVVNLKGSPTGQDERVITISYPQTYQPVIESLKNTWSA